MNKKQSNTTSLWTTIQRAVKEPLLEPQEFVICCGDGHEKYIQIEPAESNREGLELLRIMTRDITHLHHLDNGSFIAETIKTTTFKSQNHCTDVSPHGRAQILTHPHKISPPHPNQE